MNIYSFKPREVRYDDLVFELKTSYPPTIIEKEKIEFNFFRVYRSKDVNKHRFVVVGNYKNTTANKNFEICVEELDSKDYNTSQIEFVFFKNRSTIIGLIQAVMYGYKAPEILPKIEITKVDVPEEFFDDTFVKEESMEIKEVVEEIIQVEPIVVLKEKVGRKPGVKSTSKKKVVKKPRKAISV